MQCILYKKQERNTSYSDSPLDLKYTYFGDWIGHSIQLSVLVYVNASLYLIYVGLFEVHTIDQLITTTFLYYGLTLHL